MDSLASVGCVWDQWITPSDDPLHVIQSWFAQGHELLRSLQQTGRVELITDDHRVADTGADGAFDQTLLVNPPHVQQPAENMESTAFGQLVATAIDRASRVEPWRLLWLHSRFLTCRWDAPRIPDDPSLAEYHNDELEDEGEDNENRADVPAVFLQTEPPRIAIDQTTDPDLVTAWMNTYGCQIRLIDDLIGVMLQSTEHRDVVAIVAGTSGLSLGQNGWIGHRVGPLRSCHTRLPLIVGCGGPLRLGHLTNATVLPSLIGQLSDPSASPISTEQWTQQDEEFEPRLVTHGDGQSAVRTPRWFLVRQSDQQQRLYLKPDDVEDFNDVSRIRNDVSDVLASSLDD